MRIIKTISEWRTYQALKPQESTLGFVPTMGNLHAGHASLCQRSLEACDLTVVSIFVNPTQFNQASDFAQYPKTLEADLDVLSSMGVHACFLPTEKELYQDGYRYQVHETESNHQREGLHRPGHFTGVLTIVMKLLNLVKPNKAFFGEKDFQQYQLIRDMVRNFFMEVEVISCPTIREKSMLAYSSRNNRLNPTEYRLAHHFAELFHQSLPIDTLKPELEALGLEVEYLEDVGERRFVAVHLGSVRLIDNYALEKP